MKRIFSALSLALTLVWLPAAAEDMTLDQVLDASYKAQGGLERLKSIQSATFKGTLSTGQGLEAPFTMVFKRPDKARIELVVSGTTGVQAFDGKTAWMLMPFLGQTEPQAMPAEQAETIKEQADLEGPLVDWKAKGNQVELVGLEDVDGTQAYHVKITLKNGEVRHHYIDAENFLTIKQTGKSTAHGTETEFETTLGDYKEVQGLMVPHSMESKPKGAPSGQLLTISEVVLDAPVDDSIFTMPKPAEKAAAPAAQE